MKFFLGFLFAHVGCLLGEATRFSYLGTPSEKSEVLRAVHEEGELNYMCPCTGKEARSRVKTYEIPIFSDDRKHYLKMQIGQPQKTVLLLPTAEIFDLMVVSDDSSDDKDKTSKYRTSSSKTFILQEMEEAVHDLAVDAIGKEEIKVADRIFRNVTFTVVKRSEAENIGIPETFDGFLGLSPPTMHAHLSTTVFLYKFSHLIPFPLGMRFSFHWYRRPHGNRSVGKLTITAKRQKTDPTDLQITSIDQTSWMLMTEKSEDVPEFSFDIGNHHFSLLSSDYMEKVKSSRGTEDLCEILVQSDPHLRVGEFGVGDTFLKKYQTEFIPMERKMIIRGNNS